LLRSSSFLEVSIREPEVLEQTMRHSPQRRSQSGTEFCSMDTSFILPSMELVNSFGCLLRSSRSWIGRKLAIINLGHAAQLDKTHARATLLVDGRGSFNILCNWGLNRQVGKPGKRHFLETLRLLFFLEQDADVFTLAHNTFSHLLRLVKAGRRYLIGKVSVRR
jgi:hypothetical protein